MTFTRASEKLVNLGSIQGKELDLNISSYTTGGETINAAGLGIDRDPTIVLATILGTTARHANWDRANKKLLMYAADGTQVSATTDLGAVVRLLVLY